MNGLINAWQSLVLQKKILSVLAVLATIVVFSFFLRQTTKPDMVLLYAGLDPAAAGEIVTQLETQDVVYEVRGQTIYADAKKRDILRMQLAQQGLPRQTTDGYELLDNLNSFAMTSEMFNTAYWRAKEGELARTLLAMPGIRSARVHIGTVKQSSFNRTQSAKSASVTITSISGVDKKQASAIQYLIALAVAGLAPKDVAVIDTALGIVAGPGLTDEMSSVSGGNENEKAAEIERGLLSLLEAHVGYGNARVEVALKIDHQHEVISERVIDPDSRIIKSRTSNEVSETSSGTSTNVTVASNLPEGEAGTGDNNNSERSETSEQAEYDISELRRDTEKMPGAITRMTVAVLLNDVTVTADDGTISSVARSPEELQVLKELVVVASGLDEERGDVVTLKSLPFAVAQAVEDITSPTILERFLETYLWNTIQALILGVVVLVLGLFVIKPLFTQKPVIAGALALPGTENTVLAATGLAAGGGMLTAETLHPMEDPIDTLKALASDKPEDAASLLVTWLEQEERVAS